MSVLLRLLRYASPYTGRILVAVAAMAVYAAGSVALVRIVKPIIDDLLVAGAWNGRIALAILGAYALKGVGDYVSKTAMTDVGQRVVMDLRTELYRHTLNQSAAFFARRTSGQLLSRITNDVGQVQQTVSETTADLVRETLAVAGLGAYLFFIDWRLAVVCLTSAPLIVYPLVRLGQRVRRTSRRGQEELERLTHVAAEGLTGHRIVKAFGAERREVDRFAGVARVLYRTNLRVASAVAALPPLMEILGGVAAIGAIYWGTRQIAGGELTAGAFTSFLTAAFLMYGPMKKLSRVNPSLQQGLAAAERIFAMLDTHTEVPDAPGAPPLPPLSQSVEFRDVGFAYDDEPGRFVLRRVSFSVRAGQLVAIVGLSGAGKTSLVNLIPRFYDVTEGAVLIDGRDTRSVALASLREQVALVTQETVLFDDTVAANIAYGAPGATPAEIERAARAAHAHEFISELPGGYGARIGERGQRLSGGQRQRLAIARAILRQAPLLILDEATSALDAESELLVQDALANLMRDRTTFVIAHRLSTVRRADLIVALERGEVAEVGAHDALVDRPGGVYAKLYALQAFDADPEASTVAGGREA